MMEPPRLIPSHCLTGQKLPKATGKHRTARATTSATGGRETDGSPQIDTAGSTCSAAASS